MENLTLWVIFNLFVLLLLALDLGVFHRAAKAVSLREATFWSIAWVLVAIAFNASMLLWYPAHADAGLRQMRALEFFTGYLIERALSIDNIFVFLVLFNYFGVKPEFQYRVLFWGILGALIMRGAMIAAGTALITRFEWILYVFGAFLVWTGWKLLSHGDTQIEPEHNPVLRLARKYLRVTKQYDGQKFFTRHAGVLYATPMFLVLLVVETTDVAFALDSIPAIFAITKDPFIIYSSNVFAILGLRALYFLLAGAMPYFRYLNVGLAVVLMFIGAKMLAEKWIHISTLLSLGIVGVVLAGSVAASLVASLREKRGHAAPAHAPAQAAAPGESAGEAAPESPVPGWIEGLAEPNAIEREGAMLALYREGAAMGEAAIAKWRADAEFASLLVDLPTVGIAVEEDMFARIREACGRPPLADVPPDQDAQEFELHQHCAEGEARLDILTRRTPDANGAIEKFLAKFGAGIQQVEFNVSDVDRATAIARDRFGSKPVYPETRTGAGGTRVNFFLMPAPDGKRVLVELVESKDSGARSQDSGKNKTQWARPES